MFLKVKIILSKLDLKHKFFYILCKLLPFIIESKNYAYKTGPPWSFPLKLFTFFVPVHWNVFSSYS